MLREYMGWTAVITGLVLLIIVTCVVQSVTLRVFLRVWQRRKLPDQEFADKFFAGEQKGVAVKVRQLLAHYLPVNVERIQPGDLLVDDLGLSARLSRGLDLVAFVEDLEEEYKIKFGEEDYLRMQTFRDAVCIVAEKKSTVA